jgi:hypothetical protein
METDQDDEALMQGFDEAWDEEDVDTGVSDARVSCRCTFYDDDGRVVPGEFVVSLPVATLRDLCSRTPNTQTQETHDLDLHHSFSPSIELLSRLNPNISSLGQQRFTVVREWLTSVSSSDALCLRGFVKQDPSLVDILNQIDSHIAAAATSGNAILKNLVMSMRDGDDDCAIPFHWVQEMTTTRSSEDPSSADIEPKTQTQTTAGNKRGRGGQRASALDKPHTFRECLALIKRAFL